LLTAPLKKVAHWGMMARLWWCPLVALISKHRRGGLKLFLSGVREIQHTWPAHPRHAPHATTLTSSDNG
jgi:hypothetical protein